MDSQVVLQWLLADSISTKSVLTRNRVKDIALFKKSLLEDYGITVQFRYVKSEDNPCDLLTRGLSFYEFVKQLSYPLVPYPHTYIALYHSHAKLPVTHTHTHTKQEIVNHPSLDSSLVS